ncbi:MAG TPA: glycosyltransferase family 2 protein [Roseiflexaceae bacterium]|nr:glycosyltransferase family 2 protein [Roseiflexaceae bacterium]
MSATNTSESLAIALIIPSLDGDVAPLLESVHRQTLQPAEIAVVRGVRPNGRARNQGVSQTSAPLLVFVDDDAVLGDEHALANLVAPLVEDRSIGVTGASKLLPPGAPWFQRWAGREVPRIVHPIVERPLETNPDPPSFYCEITTTCCALRRAVFEEAGGFDETLVRGVDTEFFVRLRRLSPQFSVLSPHYRFILVPRTWTYHPAPATLRALLRKQFLYGYGHAQEVRRDPARARGRTLRTPLHAAAFLLFRTAILLPNVFLPYSFAAPSWRLGFKPLKALASYASALGYVRGWYRDTV